MTPRTVGVTLTTSIASIAIGALLTMFVWSAREMSIVEGLNAVVSTRWGITTLADLGVGLVLIGAWIFLLERKVLRVLPWWIGLALLGNFTALVYVVYRSRKARTVRELVLGRG